MKAFDSNRCVLNPDRANLLELLSFDKKIVRAKGDYLYDEDGAAYLDFTSQYGAVPFGHNPDFLWDCLLEQRHLSPGVMIQPFPTIGAEALAEKLIQVGPEGLQHVTFASSGAEAIEIAFKLACASTQRKKILSAESGFHGKTMAAALATGNPYYRTPFYQERADFVHIPYDDLQALERELESGEYAGFVVEPVQGEGGMIVPSSGYLKGCEELCRRYKTLFIVDEIQTGLGRTGKLFACEREQVKPDVLVISKTLGGGLIPISACICSKKAWSRDFGQRHSSTFANNHLAAIIGMETVNFLTKDPGVLQLVESRGSYLANGLRELVAEFPKAYRGSSGIGLMQGLELQPWLDDSYATNVVSHLGYSVPLVSSFLLNRFKIITAPTLNKSALRIQPNYLVKQEQIDQLIQALREIGEIITNMGFSQLFRVAMGLPDASHETEKKSEPVACSYPSSMDQPKLGTFAFLIHPTQANDLLASLPGAEVAYRQDESGQIQQWFEKLKQAYPFAAPAHYAPCIESRLGGYVDGWLISSPLTPREMMLLREKEKIKLLQSYVDVAQSLNANVIGLGAFTSVISRGGAMLENCGTPITTGNSLTALSSTDSVRKICGQIGQSLRSSHLGVVGAVGSVGRLSVLDLAPECASVTFLGNPNNRLSKKGLEAVAGELLTEILENFEPNRSPILQELDQQGIRAEFSEIAMSRPQTMDEYRQLYQAVKTSYEAKSRKPLPITITTDLARHLPSCSIVITATSNGEAFIKSEYLSPGTIVCDVARPSDLTAEVTRDRSDLVVYEGGLVHLPKPYRFGRPNVVGLETGISLACLSETIILAMSKASKNFSIGGRSSISEAREVFEMGMEHGFRTVIPQVSLDDRADLSIVASLV